MAGEFLTAGKLFKRGLQVAVTVGNAKAIDLFVNNPRTGRTFEVQAKAVRMKSCYPLRNENVRPDHIYVFVVLNGPKEDEDNFVVPGKDILNAIDRFFGTSYQRESPPKFPGIKYGPLKDYKDKWEVFEGS